MTDRKGPADPNFERKTGMHPALGAPYKPESPGTVIRFPEMASVPYREFAKLWEGEKESSYVLHADATGPVDGMYFEGCTLYASGAKAEMPITFPPTGKPVRIAQRSYHNTHTAYLFRILNEGEARLQRMEDGMEPFADFAAVTAQQVRNKQVREDLIRAMDGFTDADRRPPSAARQVLYALAALSFLLLAFAFGGPK